MSIGKAVITAASESQLHLPLQTFVDGQGRNRKVLGLLVDEAVSAGIEDVAVVIRPGAEPLYRDAIDRISADVTFIEQHDPRGFGHAVLSADAFTQDAPFLLMVSDHAYVSDASAGQSCASQLIRVANEEACIVSGVQPTHEGRLKDFGAIGGTLHDAARELYEVVSVLEKPTPTQAEQILLTPGIRNGYYLCFFGIHVLYPSVMEVLKENESALPDGAPLELSSALQEAARRGRYLAQVIQGRRYDLDSRHGLLIGQLAMSLSGRYRDEVLSGITDLLATGAMRNGSEPSS